MDEHHDMSAARRCVTQFGYPGIGVSDLGAWQDFAANVLGLQENGRAKSLTLNGHG